MQRSTFGRGFVPRSMWDRTACFTELHKEPLLACEGLIKFCTGVTFSDVDADSPLLRLYKQSLVLLHNHVLGRVNSQEL